VVHLIEKGEKDPGKFIIRVYDSIDFKYSYEFPFEHSLKDEEQFVEIEFGRYSGPLFFLVTDKNQILKANFKSKIEISVVQEADDTVKEIQFSPNMQWALNIFKDEDEKAPILTSLISSKRFELPGVTRNRKFYR